MPCQHWWVIDLPQVEQFYQQNSYKLDLDWFLVLCLHSWLKWPTKSLRLIGVVFGKVQLLWDFLMRLKMNRNSNYKCERKTCKLTTLASFLKIKLLRLKWMFEAHYLWLFTQSPQSKLWQYSKWRNDKLHKKKIFVN